MDEEQMETELSKLVDKALRSMDMDAVISVLELKIYALKEEQDG